MRFKDFYYLTENILKRREQRNTVERLRKYFNHPTAMISFREEIPASSFKYPNTKDNPLINPLVGINPRTKYKTPNGIYGYPIALTKDLIETNSLPFASDRDYVVVYKPKDGVPIIRTSTFSLQDLKEKKKLIAKKYFENNLKSVDEIEESISEDYKKSPAQTLWSITREMSLTLKKNPYDSNIPTVKVTNPNKWTKILISIGVPVFIDDSGEGTIHEAEPIQGVIFGRQYLDILDTFENNFSENSRFRGNILDVYEALYNTAPYDSFNYKNLAENGIHDNTKIENLPERLKSFYKTWKQKNILLDLLGKTDKVFLKIKLDVIDKLYYFIFNMYRYTQLEYDFSDYRTEAENLVLSKDEIYQNEISLARTLGELYGLINAVEKELATTPFASKLETDFINHFFKNLDFNHPETFRSIIAYYSYGMNRVPFLLKNKIKTAIKSNPKKLADYMLFDVKKAIQSFLPMWGPDYDLEFEDFLKNFKDNDLQSIRNKFVNDPVLNNSIRFVVENFPENTYAPFFKKYVEISE